MTGWGRWPVKAGVPYITSLNDASLVARAAVNDERGYLIAGDAKFRDEALSRQGEVDESLASARALGAPA
jgi:methyl-accepting chemotaxis protein